MSLDFMRSPAPDQPGLLIRDPYRYSDAVLVVPPALVESLQCFDGRQTELELRALLVQLTQDIRVGELEKHLIDTLSSAGFLEDENFERLKTDRHRTFAGSALRQPAHVGSAYPGNLDLLQATIRGYLDGAPDAPAIPDGLLGIAAPHVSPEGGWKSYRAAYRVLGPQYRDRIFVILGTSHYGEPEKFGLTRKPFLTPLGETGTATDLVDWLEHHGGSAVEMEDYCHCFEHTIELQVIFLQHLYGPDVRILPILCGPYARSLYGQDLPERDESVQRFLDALGELAARQADRLFWILGVDMAHMGSRYHDPFPARADEGVMAGVAERDRRRTEQISAGDAAAFWELVRENHDDLKWCGSSPLYTFLKALPQARGELLHYDQWNIDPQSVVSFAGMAFRPA